MPTKQFFLLLCALCILLSGVNAQSEYKNESYILKGTLIAKVKPEYRNSCKSQKINNHELNQLFDVLKVNQTAKVFPLHQPPEKKLNAFGFPLVDISLIYEVHYQSGLSLGKVLGMLRNTGIFEYVEPKFVPLPMYIPNDPKIGNEYYIAKIKAYEAWELEQGDSSVVIGITDTGTDDDHEDLIDNLKYNYNDPVDGIDNDNDTYIDNFRGWDLGENDNDPQVAPGGGNSSHGVLICGIAAASTDNLTGVAGVGFKCKFLPVKVANAAGQFTRAFEGIVYAADHNCAVINCSWGAPYTAGQFGQDIVNYATFNRNALVVAAAGNDGLEIPYYPASYDNVLSVAATDASDNKMFVYSGYASTYGYFVDVCAPGKDILSTWDYPYFYKSLSGTSMASAVVSGAAAIVKSHYPQLSALQLAEKLRVSCDSIDYLAPNIPYATKLGMGRINLLKAVSQDSLSSVRLKSVVYQVSNSQSPGPGDTVAMKAVFFNYLSLAPGLSIKLSSTSPGITLIDSIFTPGNLNASDSVNNLNLPFRFVVNPAAQTSETAFLKLTYTDAYHKTFEFTPIVLAADFLTLSNGTLKTTVTSKGRIGYNDDYNGQGIGFSYNNWNSYLSSGGFMLGASYTKVSDAVINAAHTGYDNDFKTIEKVHILANPLKADVETQAVFNDSLAASSAIGAEIKQKTYSWNNVEDKKYIIYEYTIRNTTSAAVNFLYAGIFLDWDITTFTAGSNRVAWDSATRMGYTFYIDGWPMTGISLITNGPVKHYAFDLNGANSSINLSDGFSTNEKYVALKSFRNQAGMQTSGNDVADMLSSGPFLLPPGDSLVVAFALIGGDYTEDLKASALRARMRYNNAIGIDDPDKYLSISPTLTPNPFCNQTVLTFNTERTENTDVIITDLQGRIIQTIYSGVLNPGMHSFPLSLKPKGMFLLNIRTNSEIRNIKMINLE